MFKDIMDVKLLRSFKNTKVFTINSFYKVQSLQNEFLSKSFCEIMT